MDEVKTLARNKVWDGRLTNIRFTELAKGAGDARDDQALCALYWWHHLGHTVGDFLREILRDADGPIVSAEEQKRAVDDFTSIALGMIESATRIRGGDPKTDLSCGLLDHDRCGAAFKKYAANVEAMP